MFTKTTQPAQTVTAPASPDDAGAYLLSKGWRCLGSPKVHVYCYLDLRVMGSERASRVGVGTARPGALHGESKLED
jgi:hypothetical protein